MKKQILAVVLISLQALLASHVSAQQGSDSPASQPADNGKGSGVTGTAVTSQALDREIKYTIGQDNFCAVEAPDDRFFGLYKYPGKEPRYWEYAQGEPIVKLEAGQKGRFQPHGVPSLAISWWLESDCKGNVSVRHNDRGDYYILVMRYEEGSDGNYPKGSFNRVSLTVFGDDPTLSEEYRGKTVILGERIKE